MRRSKVGSSTHERAEQTEVMLAEHFARAGWRVNRQKAGRNASRPDMVVRRGKTSYAVELKVASEGRSDRLIPLWSQAYIQASRSAADHQTPLVVVAAPMIPPRAAEQILEFAAKYAPGAAAGVIDFAGLRRFRGPHLENLDSNEISRPPIARSARSEPTDLFSDLNQWLLKVLLAPELPEQFLSAPRGRYRNPTELARAANVSVMTAFRLVRQLRDEGYLHESEPHLSLVRREDLFRRWQASAARRIKELPMRFLLRGDPNTELKRMTHGRRACLGLFAAADALHLGFVSGVPQHVYVRRLGSTSAPAGKNLVPAERGEVPDVILRQAAAPQSLFRGVVMADDLPVSDVLQIWSDVSSHPSRGREQADLIRRRVLEPIIQRS